MMFCKLVLISEMLNQVNELTGGDYSYHKHRNLIKTKSWPHPLKGSGGKGKGVQGYHPEYYKQVLIDVVRKHAEMNIPWHEAVTKAISCHKVTLAKSCSLALAHWLANLIGIENRRASKELEEQLVCIARENPDTTEIFYKVIESSYKYKKTSRDKKEMLSTTVGKMDTHLSFMSFMDNKVEDILKGDILLLLHVEDDSKLHNLMVSIDENVQCLRGDYNIFSDSFDFLCDCIIRLPNIDN